MATLDNFRDIEPDVDRVQFGRAIDFRDVSYDPCTPCPPPPVVLITNRVWYIVGGYEVRWQTAAPDTIGAFYPGPGVFGVNTTDYVIDDPWNSP